MPDFGRWTSNGGDPSLNEINRTDRFLDALAFEQPVYATDPGEAELINLLSGWRDDIRDAPLTVPVTPRDAVIALDSAQRARKRSRRTLALVGSTAAAVLCLGGFASVVAGAGPGDSLYGLRTMIFGEQPATRDDAVMLASQQLAEVQQLVDEGQWDAAQQKLQTLTTTVATVNDDVRKQELVSEWQELTVKVDAQDAAAVLPPDVPPPVFPDVPVSCSTHRRLPTPPRRRPRRRHPQRPRRRRPRRPRPRRRRVHLWICRRRHRSQQRHRRRPRSRRCRHAVGSAADAVGSAADAVSGDPAADADSGDPAADGIGGHAIAAAGDHLGGGAAGGRAAADRRRKRRPPRHRPAEPPSWHRHPAASTAGATASAGYDDIRGA